MNQFQNEADLLQTDIDALRARIRMASGNLLRQMELSNELAELIELRDEAI